MAVKTRHQDNLRNLLDLSAIPIVEAAPPKPVKVHAPIHDRSCLCDSCWAMAQTYQHYLDMKKQEFP
jgi:hypothetical protein